MTIAVAQPDVVDTVPEGHFAERLDRHAAGIEFIRRHVREEGIRRFPDVLLVFKPAGHIGDGDSAGLLVGHSRALAGARKPEFRIVGAFEPDRRLLLRDPLDNVVFGAYVVPETEERRDATFLRAEVELFRSHAFDGFIEHVVHRNQAGAQEGMRRHCHRMELQVKLWDSQRVTIASQCAYRGGYS